MQKHTYFVSFDLQIYGGIAMSNISKQLKTKKFHLLTLIIQNTCSYWIDIYKFLNNIYGLFDAIYHRIVYLSAVYMMGKNKILITVCRIWFVVFFWTEKKKEIISWKLMQYGTRLME